MGTCILVPKGVPLSSMSTRLLLSNLGTFGACFCFNPTSIPFLFSPLIATKILSPERFKRQHSDKYDSKKENIFHVMLHFFVLPIYPTPTLL